jgi:hypothetical protein
MLGTSPPCTYRNGFVICDPVDTGQVFESGWRPEMLCSLLRAVLPLSPLQ